MSDAAADLPYEPPPEPARPWFGWIAFGGAMMIVLGSFHVIAGLVALLDDQKFLVSKSGLVVEADYTAWGWTHLILGIVIALAGIGLFSGQTWARIVAVMLAMFSAVANLAFLAANPIWSTIMIAIDILVIYAVLVYGDKRTLNAP
jgi:hypothetical protein